DLDDPVIGQQLRVRDDLRRCPGRCPPDTLAFKSHFPLRQRTLGDELVENPNDLDTVSPDGRSVGEAGVKSKFGPSERSADRPYVARRLETREEEPPTVGSPVRIHERSL